MAIEVKRLMEPEKHLTLVGFFKFLISPDFRSNLKISLALLAFIIFAPVVIGVFLFMLIIAWPFFKPFVVGVHFKYFRQKKLLEEAEVALTEFIGKSVKYENVSISGRDGSLSASGLAYDNGFIFIMDHGLAAKVPWADVRNWNWNIAGHNTVTVYGGNLKSNMAGNLSASINNAIEKSRAHAESGFFIGVSDIDYPKWQFTSVDEKVLTRWFEIFKQLDEGTLK